MASVIFLGLIWNINFYGFGQNDLLEIGFFKLACLAFSIGIFDGLFEFDLIPSCKPGHRQDTFQKKQINFYLFLIAGSLYSDDL